MEIEQLEIRDFLASCPPLDGLEPAALEALVNALEISYVRKGDHLLTIGGRNDRAYLIRTGALEVADAGGGLIGRFSEGEWVGYRSVMRGGEVHLAVNALEDSLLYAVPDAVFMRLLEQFPQAADFFHEEKNRRLKRAVRDLRNSDNMALISLPVARLIHRDPLLVEGCTTIQDAARRMTEATSTAMLVMKEGHLEGIVTDRAFCTKVVAAGHPLDGDICEVMTRNPITIEANALGAEALLIMARHNIRHLPVMESGRVLGMVTATDLIRSQSHNAIYLINEIHRARDLDALVGLNAQLPDVLVALVEAGLTADNIGHAISSIAEAITRRLLDMAVKALGPAPVAFAWIAAGSLARREQTAQSDQDNGLMLADDFDPQRHGEYFERLARQVCDGLNACGYVYCPGEVMAINPRWRQPVSVWRTYFREWIDTPAPKALMYTSIFFDLRCIYGDASLLESLRGELRERMRDNSIFLAHMAANALHYSPPLGFFRNFVLEDGGTESRALNMKKRGVMPVIDLARVYALSVASLALATPERLQAAAGGGALSESGMQDLRDAYELITMLRLKHQAKQIQSGNRRPDNYVPPEHLSSLERRHLKDAFEVVRGLQEAMAMRYQTGRLG